MAVELRPGHWLKPSRQTELIMCPDDDAQNTRTTISKLGWSPWGMLITASAYIVLYRILHHLFCCRRGRLLQSYPCIFYELLFSNPELKWKALRLSWMDTRYGENPTPEIRIYCNNHFVQIKVIYCFYHAVSCQMHVVQTNTLGRGTRRADVNTVHFQGTS